MLKGDDLGWIFGIFFITQCCGTFSILVKGEARMSIM